MRITRRRLIGLAAAGAAAGLLPSRAPAATAAGCEVDAFSLALEDGGARASATGWRTLKPARAPRRFDLAGLRWQGSTRVEAEIRTRTARGGWSPWTRLHPLGEHREDGAGARPGTEPAWTGPADLIQVRHRGAAPRNLRACFVHAAPSVPTRATTARARQVNVPGPASGPRIVPRPEWGADQCPPKSEPSYGNVQLAFVHHTVSTNDYQPQDSAAIVLGICRYHRDHNGWNDIGYNLLVDRYGQVFEGRSGGTDQPVVGAQAQGYNSQSTGIALIGDFSALPQAEAGLDALARILGWKLPLHGVPVEGQVTVSSAGGETNRHPNGTPVVFERVSGHRDGNKTACPGDALYAQLPDIRRRAAAYATPVSSITAKATAAQVRYPAAHRLTGALRFSDGASPAGAPVQLVFTAPGGAPQAVGAATADATGAWQADVALPASGELRARFPGDAAHPPLESAPLALTLLPHLTLALSARRTRRGTAIGVSGTYGPPTDKIECRLERQAGRRWVVEQRKRINVRGGKFATKVRPKRAALYRVVITAPGQSKALKLRAT